MTVPASNTSCSKRSFAKPTPDQQGRIDPSGDFGAGHYALTHTVWRNRVNLEPGRERHMGPLVGGSATKIDHFEEDACNIVYAFASLQPPSAGDAAFSPRGL